MKKFTLFLLFISSFATLRCRTSPDANPAPKITIISSDKASNGQIYSTLGDSVLLVITAKTPIFKSISASKITGNASKSVSGFNVTSNSQSTEYTINYWHKVVNVPDSSVKLVFKITDTDGKIATDSVVIKTVVITAKSVILYGLGATYLDAEPTDLGGNKFNFYSTLSYSRASAKNWNSGFDIGYLIDSVSVNKDNYLVSPDIFKQLALLNYPVSNLVTQYSKTTFSAVDFGNIKLKDIISSPTAYSKSVIVYENDIIKYQNALGKIGLIKVNKILRNGNKGYVKLDFKIISGY